MNANPTRGTEFFAPVKGKQMPITLATLEKATAQEVFDQVAAHLLNQSERSLAELSNACKYRSGKLSCAAGCLISDSEYNPAMEGRGWPQLCKAYCITLMHTELIFALQNVHDSHRPSDWREQLRKVAVSRNLVFHP